MRGTIAVGVLAAAMAVAAAGFGQSCRKKQTEAADEGAAHSGAQSAPAGVQGAGTPPSPRAYEMSPLSGPDLPAAPGGPEGSATGVPERFRDAFAHFNFVNRFHFADVDHHGIYVDFGTAHRYKYTLGDWAMGWTGDERDGRDTYTWAVDDPDDGSPNVNHRMYFFIERPEPLTFRMRYRTGTRRTLNCNLNGSLSFRLTLEPGEWNVLDREFPTEALRDGENYLQMYQSPGPAEDSSGKKRYFRVDYVWLLRDPGAVGAERAIAPTDTEVVREVAMQEEDGRSVARWSLAVPPPTTVSYYLEVPAGSPGTPTDPYVGFAYGTKLLAGGQAAPVTLEIGVTGDDGLRRVVWSRDIAPDREGRWSVDTSGSLGQYGGQIVRIDFAARARPTAGFRAVWGAPTLFVSQPRGAAERLDRTPRNVVLVLIDTQRADHMEPWETEAMRSAVHYRGGDVKTPLVRLLADQGVVFENAVAPENWTLPSAASLLSGLYPITHRAQREKDALSPDVVLLSEFLRRQGFKTAAFVGNGHVSQASGFGRGWDLLRNYIKEGKPNEAEYLFADALAWVKEHETTPFFLYVHTVDPHVPYDPGREYLQMYDPESYGGPVQPRDTSTLVENVKLRRVTLTDRDKVRLHALYKGEVTYHDDHFKKFVDALAEEGVLDDTLIVVTADHGEEFFEHGKVGHGHSLFQELVHVPLLLRFGGIPAPRRVSEYVGLCDVAPTIVDVLNLGPAAAGAGVSFEGNSLLPMLLGHRVAGPNMAFTNHQSERMAVVAAGWKLQMNGPTQTALFSIRGDEMERVVLQENGIFDWDAMRPFVRAHPITMRYLRVLIGQFLGAPDRQAWRTGDTTAAARRRYAAGTATFDREEEERLRAIGYLR